MTPPIHSRGSPTKGTKSEVKTYARGHNDAPSISKYGSLVQLDAQIAALRYMRPLSASPKRPPVGHGSKSMPGALTFPPQPTLQAVTGDSFKRSPSDTFILPLWVGCVVALEAGKLMARMENQAAAARGWGGGGGFRIHIDDFVLSCWDGQGRGGTPHIRRPLLAAGRGKMCHV